MDTATNRPLLPSLEATLYLNVQKTVSQGFRHFERHGLVCCPVTGSDHDTVVWQLMLTHNAVKGNLISRGLHRLRSGRNFIQKQDIYHIFAGVHLEDLRLQPNCQGLVCIGGRNTTQIDGIKQQQSHIGDNSTLAGILLDFSCQLANRLRFTDTGRTPQHHGRKQL